MNEFDLVRIACPFCESEDTEMFSLFGQQLLTVQYYCNHCLTPFERVKDRDILPAALLHSRKDASATDGPQ